MPAIDIPANYTRNYVTLNEKGDIILKVGSDDPIVIENENPGMCMHSLFWLSFASKSLASHYHFFSF